MNPQFHIAIPRTSNNKCHVVVSVTQHYETLPEAKVNKQLHAIGFAVYEVPHSMPRLTKQFVAENVRAVINLFVLIFAQSSRLYVYLLSVNYYVIQRR